MSCVAQTFVAKATMRFTGCESKPCLRFRRPGFTLVEMLVVLAIIGTLISISVPASLKVRAAMRRSECGLRMNQLGIAAQSHLNTRDRMPGFLESFGRFEGGSDPGDPTSFGGNVPPHEKLGSWHVALLAHLDNQPLYERWSMDRYPLISNNGEFPSTIDGYSRAAAAPVPSFVCPSGTGHISDFGLNHMVANVGLHPSTPVVTYLRDGKPTTLDFPRSQSNANGIFHNRYPGWIGSTSIQADVAAAFRQDDFRDGRSQTLLLTENANAGPWHRADFAGGVALTQLVTVGDKTLVSYPVESRYVWGVPWHFCDPKGVVGAPPVSPELKFNGGDEHIAELTPGDFISASRPSSHHEAGVNVLFADGSVQFVNEAVDYRTFQAWMTPQTTRSDMPFREFPTTSSL